MNSIPTFASHERDDGFTLVETVVAMSIVSIALLAINQSLAFGLQHSSDGISQARSLSLAQSYIEEISAKRYSESTPVGGVPACSSTTTPCGPLGPDSGEARPDFDDVDDFDGLVDAPPRDALNSIRSGYESYQAEISVRYLTAAEITLLGLDDTTDAKRLSIRITPPARDPEEFVALYGNF